MATTSNVDASAARLGMITAAPDARAKAAIQSKGLSEENFTNASAVFHLIYEHGQVRGLSPTGHLLKGSPGDAGVRAQPRHPDLRIV